MPVRRRRRRRDLTFASGGSDGGGGGAPGGPTPSLPLGRPAPVPAQCVRRSSVAPRLRLRLRRRLLPHSRPHQHQHSTSPSPSPPPSPFAPVHRVPISAPSPVVIDGVDGGGSGAALIIVRWPADAAARSIPTSLLNFGSSGDDQRKNWQTREAAVPVG